MKSGKSVKMIKCVDAMVFEKGDDNKVFSVFVETKNGNEVRLFVTRSEQLKTHVNASEKIIEVQGRKGAKLCASHKKNAANTILSEMASAGFVRLSEKTNSFLPSLRPSTSFKAKVVGFEKKSQMYWVCKTETGRKILTVADSQINAIDAISYIGRTIKLESIKTRNSVRIANRSEFVNNS